MIKNFPNDIERMGYGITMYILDYKIPKYLVPLRDELVKLYMSEYGSKLGVKITDNRRLKIEQAISCFCYNTVYQVAFSRDVVIVPLSEEYYSMPLIYNGTKVNRKISYIYSRSVFDWLHWSGRAKLEKGGVTSWDVWYGKFIPNTTGSVLHLSPELYLVFKGVCNKENCPTIPSVLSIRDRDGKEVSKRLPDYQKTIVQTLHQYNQLSKSAAITIDDNEYLVQLRKVYNNSSFEEGGRNYVTGYKVQDMMNREERHKICIDGESTVEIDFKALHPRIAATLEGEVLDKEFDPYSIELEGYDKSVSRYLGKWATLILLNTGVTLQEGKIGFNRARMALIDALRKEGRLQDFIDQGLCPKYIDYSLILESVLERNSYISNWFYEAKGLVLQNIDSKIMDLVIGHFNRIGEVIIPVHDSIVVKRRLEQEGVKVMQECFQQVLGSDDNCLIVSKSGN